MVSATLTEHSMALITENFVTVRAIVKVSAALNTVIEDIIRVAHFTLIFAISLASKVLLTSASYTLRYGVPSTSTNLSQSHFS